MNGVTEVLAYGTAVIFEPDNSATMERLWDSRGKRGVVGVSGGRIRDGDAVLVSGKAPGKHPM